MKVKITPLFMSRAGLGVGAGGNFFVFLDDAETPESLAEGSGHEVGHTFHHDLSATPPRNFLEEDSRDAVERFCKAFSEYWLAINGKKAVAERIMNEKSLL